MTTVPEDSMGEPGINRGPGGMGGPDGPTAVTCVWSAKGVNAVPNVVPRMVGSAAGSPEIETEGAWRMMELPIIRQALEVI